MDAKTPALLLFLGLLLGPSPARAQFVDSFDGGVEGWDFFTGDGDATMAFVPQGGYARLLVDATDDAHNVWWAIIKRDVSPALDLGRLADPDHELRVEARVRVSDAPRRVNIMINTNRTTDFHEHLMEYDIPDTTGWHTVSLTTRNLDVRPGDTLYVQLGATDWGPGTYHVDVDHYRADVVNARRAASDVGEPLPYHPPIPSPDAFARQLSVTHDARIHADYPDVNFNDWHVTEGGRDVPVITVGAGPWAVLRWDFGEYAGTRADGAGLLELTTHSVAHGGDYVAAYGEDLGGEFGKVRVIEILGGDPRWDQETVTYGSLVGGRPLTEVFNGQMIYDTEIAAEPGGKTFVTLSRPVLQRLLDGETKGLLLRPLGAVQATFYASEHPNAARRPTLHFSTR